MRPLVVLVPCYEPDARLLGLLHDIRGAGCTAPIVIVDDGSGPGYAPVFAAAAARGADVIGDAPNRGKGYALKAGFGHIARAYPGHDVVCADCDGQHVVADLLRVADALEGRPGTIVLGSRAFVGDVPAKSRFGNTVTRVAFARSTGRCVQDTQTGLRAYPADLLGWLQGIAGERFDYELDVLLQAAAEGRPIHEVPIETIYLEGNESSHFRPIVDSVRVYAPLVRFSLSSLTAFAIDFVAVLLLMSLTGQLALSVVAARLASATVNFGVNRRLVFDGGRARRVPSAARRYVALAGVLLLGNYALLRLLHGPFHLPLLLAKLATEASLFALSYQLQRRIVFRPVAAPPAVPSPEPDLVGPAAASQRVPSVLSGRPDDRPATSRA